jgi:NADH-quinone oxidoreductase subunit L
MHAMLGHLDMRKMSGLKTVLPKTRILLLIGCLALAGFPMFSGFLSKDEIISATWEQNRFLGVVMLFTAFLKAYYTFRLYFRTFEGPEVLPEAPAPAHGHGHEPHEEAAASESAVHTATAPASGVDVGQTHHKPGKEDHGHHHHEPWLMILPLIVLAVGAAFAGYINWPETFAEHGLAGFLGQSPSLIYSYDMVNRVDIPAAPEPFGQMTVAMAQDASVKSATNAFHRNMMIASGIIALVGIYLAYLMHLKYREESDKLAAKHPLIIRAMERKFWVDEVYQNGIVEPLRWVGRVCVGIDNFVIDGLIWVLSFVPQAGGFVLKLSTQRGYLQGYAVTMVVGVTIILLVVFL